MKIQWYTPLEVSVSVIDAKQTQARLQCHTANKGEKTKLGKWREQRGLWDLEKGEERVKERKERVGKRDYQEYPDKASHGAHFLTSCHPWELKTPGG